MCTWQSTGMIGLFAACLLSTPLSAGKSNPKEWGKIKNQSSVSLTLRITDKVLPVGKLYVKEYGGKKETLLTDIDDEMELAPGKTYLSYIDTTNGFLGLTCSLFNGTQKQKVNLKKAPLVPAAVLVYERKKPIRIFVVKFKHRYFNKFSSSHSFIYITDLVKPPKPVKDPEPEDTSAPTDREGGPDPEPD